MSLLGKFLYKTRKYYDDDFDWETYTADSYERRLTGEFEREFLPFATADQAQFDAETGQVQSAGQQLSPNQQVILEAIGQLQPASVHEVGCGGGDHVATGMALFPHISFSGADRGATQLDLAMRRHPELEGRLSLQDITMPMSKAWPRAELVYSQTVLMHIHTAVSHFVGLANMVNASSKYVVLMENWLCHNFVRDIIALRNGGHFEWDTVHMYQITGSGGARAMLLSRLPLEGYTEVTDDAQMREGIKPSERRVKRSDESSARGIFGDAPYG